jgi:hypothetical protein
VSALDCVFVLATTATGLTAVCTLHELVDGALLHGAGNGAYSLPQRWNHCLGGTSGVDGSQGRACRPRCVCLSIAVGPAIASAPPGDGATTVCVGHVTVYRWRCLMCTSCVLREGIRQGHLPSMVMY